MRNYEAKSPLFMIKRAGLNYVPRQSYSKNSHGSYILKWILVHSYFKVSVDNENKYLHKQAACWILEQHKTLLSSNRLLYVQGQLFFLFCIMK